MRWRKAVVVSVLTLLPVGGPAGAQPLDAKVLRKPLPPSGKPSERKSAMKPCVEYGAGFYRLESSDTCVKIGGSVGVGIGAGGTAGRR